MEINLNHIRVYLERYQISPALFARFINEPVSNVIGWLKGEPIPQEAQDKLRKQINLENEVIK